MTSANLLPNGEQVFLDDNGVPLALGTVSFFVPNSNTPKTTWQDSARGSMNTNPVNLDAAGRAIIWGSGSYRQLVKDALGNTIWDEETSTLNTDVNISGLNLLATDIPTTEITVTTFVTIGYSTAGDNGTGATYTSVGASGGSPGAVQDLVGTWFQLVLNIEINVGWFGAKCDGATNDTAAVASAVSAMNGLTRGELVFPAGKCITSGGFIITAPGLVRGSGPASFDQAEYGSVVVCSSSTAVLFTTTSKVLTFRDIGLLCSAATPSAGAGVFANGVYQGQATNFFNVTVSGFYDDIHIGVGAGWVIDACQITNPVRYGIFVENTVNADAGDWVITNNTITSAKAASVAAIYIETSGGGKIIGNKINFKFVNGITLNSTGVTVQLIIANNDIENVTAIPVNIVQAWPFIIITDNFLSAPAGFPCILMNGPDGFYIGGGDFEGSHTYAVVLTGTVQFGMIAPFHMNAFTFPVSGAAAATGVNDWSALALPPNVFISTIDVRVPGFTLQKLSDACFAGGAAANSAVYTYFTVSRIVTVTTANLQIGVSSGNIDIGIYQSSPGSIPKIASTGSTACPGTGIGSIALLAPAVLYPGITYYAVLALDNTTATFYTSVATGSFANTTTVGVVLTFFPLPASSVFPPSGFGSNGTPVLYFT